MPNTFTCSVCHHQFIVSDKVFEQRILGKRVTIPCKHCGAPFTMDGTGKEGGRANGRVAAGSAMDGAGAPGGPKVAQAKIPLDRTRVSAGADTVRVIAAASPVAEAIAEASGGGADPGVSEVSVKPEVSKTTKPQPPRPSNRRPDPNQSLSPLPRSPGQARGVSSANLAVMGQSSTLRDDAASFSQERSIDSPLVAQAVATESTASLVPKRVSVPRPQTILSRASKPNESIPTGSLMNSVDAPVVPRPASPTRSRLSGDGYQAVTSQMLLQAEPVAPEEPIVPTPVVEIGAEKRAEASSVVPDGRVTMQSPPPLPGAQSAVPPLPRSPAQIGGEPVEPLRQTLPGGPPPMPSSSQETAFTNPEPVELPGPIHLGRASAVPPLPSRATPECPTPTSVDQAVASRSASAIPPLPQQTAPIVAPKPAQPVQDQGRESELTPLEITRALHGDVSPSGLPDTSHQALSPQSLGDATAERPQRKSRIGKIAAFGVAAVLLSVAALVGGRIFRGPRVNATAPVGPVAQVPRGLPTGAVAHDQRREFGASPGTETLPQPQPLPLPREESSAAVAPPTRAPLPRSEASAGVAPPNARASTVDAESRSASDDAIPSGVAKTSLILQVEVALRRAQRCHPEGRPAGTAQIFVTMSPRGTVSDLKMVGEPLASAGVAGCILQQMRALRIPAFEGDSFTFVRSITMH